MRCPACRAHVDQGPLCRRCRADLSMLFRLEGERTRALTRAYAALARGQWNEVEAAGGRVDALQLDAEGRRLRALSALLQRDFPRAWRAYLRARRPATP